MNYRKISFAIVLGVVAFSATNAHAANDPHTPDRQAIQKILDDFNAARNKFPHDVRAMANLFSQDADFVVITAKHLKGREEIFEYHDNLVKGRFKGRTDKRKATWEDLRFIRPDVAIGHAYFEPADPNATGIPSRTALALVVMTKEKGKWWIVALHNTLKYGPPLSEQSSTDKH